MVAGLSRIWQDLAGFGRTFLRPGGERKSRLRGRGVLKFRTVYLKFSERWFPTPMQPQGLRRIVNASRIPPAPPVLGDRPRWYEEGVEALRYWRLVAGLWSEGSLDGALGVPWGSQLAAGASLDALGAISRILREIPGDLLAQF